MMQVLRLLLFGSGLFFFYAIHTLVVFAADRDERSERHPSPKPTYAAILKANLPCEGSDIAQTAIPRPPRNPPGDEGLLRRALVLFTPQGPLTLLTLAELLIEKGHNDSEARRLLETILPQKPNCPEIAWRTHFAMARLSTREEAFFYFDWVRQYAKKMRNFDLELKVLEALRKRKGNIFYFQEVLECASRKGDRALYTKTLCQLILHTRLPLHHRLYHCQHVLNIFKTHPHAFGEDAIRAIQETYSRDFTILQSTTGFR